MICMISYVLQPDLLTQNHQSLQTLYIKQKNKSLPISTFTLVPQLFTTDNHALKVSRHLHMMMVLFIYSDLMKMPNGKKIDVFFLPGGVCIFFLSFDQKIV